MAKPDTIPITSTISDIVSSLANPTEYVRKVVENFYASGLDRTKAEVRIGVAGKGITPHYKIEHPASLDIDGDEFGFTNTFQIYNGSNHKQMTAFDVEQIHGAHWSTKTMTFDEVSELLRNLRSKKKGTANVPVP